MPKTEHPTVSDAALKKKKGIPKSKRPKPPSTGATLAQRTYSKSDMYSDVAKGVATAAKAMPSYGRTSKAIKAGLSGFASGVEIGAARQRLKESGLKGSKSQGTVSEAASAQMSKAHKKDKTRTKRV
jgi:hypothetical protein